MFQIWFDPDLSRTLRKPAGYDDYRLEQFPTHAHGRVTVRTIIGPGSPFWLDTPGVQVYYLQIPAGETYRTDLLPEQVLSAYVVKGAVTFNGQTAPSSAFALFAEEPRVETTAIELSEVFFVLSPGEPGYATYG